MVELWGTKWRLRWVFDRMCPSVRLSNHPSTHPYACQQHAKGTPYNELYSSIFQWGRGTAEGFINKFFSTTDRRQAGPTKSNDPQIDWQTDGQTCNRLDRRDVTLSPSHKRPPWDKKKLNNNHSNEIIIIFFYRNENKQIKKFWFSPNDKVGV